jgi:NADP-dependent 3-hydroxy acid dehydrogenase YdfG
LSNNLPYSRAVSPGQLAVVTGATSGIGKAIALGLAEQGVSLYLVGRNLEALEVVTGLARPGQQQILCHQADLTLDKDILNLASRVKQDFGYVDLLIHSAGVILQGRLESAPVEDFDLQYRTNVRAPYLLTQALLPLLKARRGQVVFVNSSAALNARANVGQYAATKSALKSLADSLREEVNADGLSIMSVFLGRTATPMQASVQEKEGRAYHPELLLQPDDVAMLVLNALTLPRTAEVTDISIRPLIKSY